MSKKRTSAEANNDEQTNEGSDPMLHHEDNAKRAKLTPLSDTTLQDLPIHLIERILVKAVVMEVKGMRLAKSVWKEKADLVISRLKNVSLHWSKILTTNEFLTEVHRILDAEKTIRLEILYEPYWIPFSVLKVTTIKDEIFILCRQEDQIKVNVYDRNNMAEVKYAIALTGTSPVDMEACNVSNCVYVLCLNMERKCPSVLRSITKDEEHQFNIKLPWISDLKLPISSISVFQDGNIAVPHGQDPATVSIYNANGSLVSSADIYGFRYVDRVIQKSNGNLVLASINGDRCERVLTEIDTDGKIQRQYKSSVGEGSSVSIVDMNDRIMISKQLIGFELLDSELNLMESFRVLLPGFVIFDQFHYNSKRNEEMKIFVWDSCKSLLRIHRYTEK